MRMSETRWWISASWPRLVDPEEFDRIELTVKVGDFIVPKQFEATVIREDVRDDGTPDESSPRWPPIRMQLQVENGRPVIWELTIGERPEPPVFFTPEDRTRLSPEELHDLFHPSGDRRLPPRRHVAITASLLRELPLARLAKYAMLGVAYRFGDGPAAEEVVPNDLRDDAGFYRVGPNEVPEEYGVYIIDTPAWQELWSDQMEALATQVDHASMQKRRNRITDDLLTGVAEVYRQAIAERRPPKKAVQTNWHVSEATAGRYIMHARERGHLGKTVRGKKGEISE